MNNIFIKTPKQIDGIRKSCKLAAQSLQWIEPYVQAGVTTLELNNLLDSYIRSHGGQSACLGYNNFPKSVCISLNEVVCHGVPDNTIIKNGDILNIDVTVILNGFYGDTSKMYSIGKISEDAKHLLEVTKKCLELGIKRVKPGAMTGEIGHAIYTYAILQGCSVVEAFCGHGVGIEFHECPQICHVAEKSDGVVMFTGMTFTIEPMICLKGPDVVIDETDKWTVRTQDGGLSAQFEHTILVCPGGYEILTVL